MMPSQDRMRASEADREGTVERLRQAYVAGRLDLAELRDRASAAYAARTWGDLRQLTADLPGHAVRTSTTETSVTVRPGGSPPFPTWARQRGPRPAAWCFPPMMAGLVLLFLAAGWLVTAMIPLLALCLSAVCWGGPRPYRAPAPGPGRQPRPPC